MDWGKSLGCETIEQKDFVDGLKKAIAHFSSNPLQLVFLGLTFVVLSAWFNIGVFQIIGIVFVLLGGIKVGLDNKQTKTKSNKKWAAKQKPTIKQNEELDLEWIN